MFVLNICYVRYISTSSVSAFGKLVYYLCSFSGILVSSLVYNSSYASSLAIATALLAALLASLYAQCCSSLLSFWYVLNASSLALKARRVSSFHHRLSFYLFDPFPLVCPNLSLAVETKINLLYFVPI